MQFRHSVSDYEQAYPISANKSDMACALSAVMTTCLSSGHRHHQQNLVKLLLQQKHTRCMMHRKPGEIKIEVEVKINKILKGRSNIASKMTVTARTLWGIAGRTI